MIVAFITFMAVVSATIFFSYWHGRGDGPDLKKQWYETKGVLIAGEAIVGALAGFLMLFNPIGLLGSIISPYYWFLWRTSKQARAELDYMGRVRNKIIKVLQGYYLPTGVNCLLILVGSVLIGVQVGDWRYPLLVIPCLASVAAPYITAKNFRNDPGETARYNRARVEIANGFTGGVNVASAILVSSKVVTVMGYGL